MTYKRFEDLPVWNKAIDLALAIFDVAEENEAAFRRRASLKSQLERAAISVSNNISEGFERGTTNELLSFLYIARGSAGEVRSMLCLIERIAAFRNLKSEISNLKSMAEGVSRQLRGWADKLQNSEIRGQRHLNDKSRQVDQEKARRAGEEADRKAFMEQVARIARGEEAWRANSSP